MRVLHFLDRWKKQETDEEEENKSLRRRSNRNSFLDNLELMMEIMMAAIKQLWIETLVWMCFFLFLTLRNLRWWKNSLKLAQQRKFDEPK